MSYVSSFLTKSLHSKLEYPFHIMDWNYHTEDGWMRSTGNDEIIVECIGEEDRQKEGKRLVGLIVRYAQHIFSNFSQIFFCNQLE